MPPEQAKELSEKMMEVLADPTKLGNQFGIDFSRFGQQRSRSQLIEMHRDSVARDRSFWRNAGSGSLVLQTTQNFYTKPTSRQAPRLSACTPVQIRGLQLNTTHRGRVLKGKLVEGVALLTSAQCLLEDAAGDVVNVSFYCFPFTTHPASRQRVLRELRDGRRVAIIEPFYKIGGVDGVPMVRVDEAVDVVWLDDEAGAPAEPTLESLRADGNAHFKAHEYSDAVVSYSGALACVNGSGVPLSALLNLAAAHLKLSDPSAALLYAVSALRLAGSSTEAPPPKACYRAAAALQQLGECGAALWILTRIPPRDRSPEVKTLERQLAALHDRGSPPPTEAAFVRAVAALQTFPQSHPPGAEASPKEAAEHKQRGVELYGSGDVLGACAEWRHTLAHTPVVAALLLNRALCQLQMGEHGAAVLDATAALSFDRCAAKAHYRRAQAMLNLEALAEAAAAAQAGLQLCPEVKELEELQARIASAVSMATPAPQPSATAPKSGGYRDILERVFSEREMDELLNRGNADAGMLSGMRQMMALATALDPAAAAKLKAAGMTPRDVPKFHLEFSSEGRWPVAADVPRCRDLLHQTYEQSTLDFMQLTDLELRGMDAVDPPMLLKRLGSTDPATRHWWRTAALGHWRERARAGCGSFSLQSFGNVEPMPVTLLADTVHVAVGFADLGELSACDISGPEGGCVRWIGYDLSSHAVAKALVLLQMLGDDAPPDAVLQVWYSATWTRATLHAFRSALTQLLHAADGAHPPDVLRMLRHWQLHDVPLATARRLWLDSAFSGHGDVANLVQEQDRHAMCAYMLSGDLLGSEVGSVAMFALPPGAGSRATSESFLRTIPRDELYAARKGGAPDVVAAGVECVRRRIDRLQSALRSGRLCAEVRVGRVGLREEAILDEIRNLEPATMSWSNVCDYSTAAEFHATARRCSTPATLHSLYSMNWLQDVKGTMVVDLLTFPDGVDVRALHKRALQTVKKQSGAAALSRYLAWPPFGNPWNVIDAMLSREHLESWFRHFRDAVKGGVAQAEIVSTTPFHVFARAATPVVQMHFRYGE